MLPFHSRKGLEQNRPQFEIDRNLRIVFKKPFSRRLPAEPPEPHLPPKRAGQEPDSNSSGPGQEAFPGIQGNGFPRHPGMLFLLASLYRVFLSFLIFRADRHIPPHSFLSGRFRDTAGAFRRPASRKKPQTHKSAAGPEPLRTDSYRKSCKPPDAESGARQHEANLRQSAGNQSQKRYARVYARKRQEP